MATVFNPALRVFNLLNRSGGLIKNLLFHKPVVARNKKATDWQWLLNE
jgi:hypothetical protein